MEENRKAPLFTPEQSQVIEHEKGNIIVTASAGSGKTFTMIERAKRLIIEGKARVKEILAVTFTEKAALEMKEKLKKALCDRIIESGDKSLVRELNDVATADVSTLHAFCGRLIRTYFYVVGLSPDFNIVDETDAAKIREEAIKTTFREFYDSGEKWFLNLVDRYSQARSDERLKELIVEAYFFCASDASPELLMRKHQEFYTKDGVQDLQREYKGYIDDRISALIKQAQLSKSVFLREGKDKGVELAQKLLDDLIAAKAEQDILSLTKMHPYSLRLDFERKAEGQVLSAKNQLIYCRDKFKKLILGVYELISKVNFDEKSLKNTLENTDEFVRVLKRFSEVYAEKKREENVLDFNDLEHFALKVLQDQTVKEEVSSRYKYVFVDEYQDTNGVQEEILSKVCNDNLLMVGDVKQSIYGFRGCRPEIFSNKAKEMEKSGQKTVMLNDNFRSARAVIDCVNQIFNYCMTEEYFEENYQERSQLKFGHGYPDGQDGRAELHLLRKSAKKEKTVEEPRIYDVLSESQKSFDQDTDKTTALLTKIINEERGKTYYDVKEKKQKRITLSDIVILTRSRNTAYVRNLVKGLNKHGIGVSSEVKENVCDFPETILLINVLKLLDCFSQDLPLAAVMKSPVGGFSEEELFEIASFPEDSGKRVDNFFKSLNFYLDTAKTPLVQKIKDFVGYIDKLRFYADFVGAKGALERLIEEKNLESYFLIQNSGEIKVQRVRRFLAAAQKEGRSLTVSEFLSKIQSAGSAAAFGFSQSGDRDAVTIMTIHASKGLEFPVVIACGLERALNTQEERDEVYFSRTHGLATKEYDQDLRVKRETLLRAVIKESMRKERVKEEMRLFYVAATRAKYSLHLTFGAKEDSRKELFTGADKFIDYIPKSLPLTEWEEDDLSFLSVTRQTRKIIVGEGDAQTVKRMQSAFANKYPFTEDTLLPLKTNVTAATALDIDKEFAPVVLFREESTDIERGNIAHKIMEHLDFSSDLSVLEQARLMVQDGVITNEQLEKVSAEKMQLARDRGAFNDISGKALYREKDFIVAIEADKVLGVTTRETVLLQGVIDLLVLSDEGAEIIDYKYSSKGADALKSRYAKQLELYAYATEKILGVKVIKKKLVNLVSGEVVDIR